MSYRLPHWPKGLVKTWIPNIYQEFGIQPTPEPTELFEWIAAGGLVEAHNAMMEKAIWRAIMMTEYLWPDIPRSQWRCSSAKASSYGLPRGLEKACIVMRLPVQKDKEGHKLMMKLCKPRKPSKNDPREWWGSREEFLRLFRYCETDVLAEETFSHSLLDLIPLEQELWKIDQDINEHGLPIDRAFVETAIAHLNNMKDQANAEINRRTNGQVPKATNRQALLDWLNGQGLELDNTQAATFDAMIAMPDDIPEHVLAVIKLVRRAGRASVAKYKAIMERLTAGDRVRDMLVYAGASRTSRWSGAGFQPQNLPRGSIKDMEATIERIMASDEITDLENEFQIEGEEATDLFQLFSEALRGAIVPDPGMELVSADYNAIEARGLFWVCNHERGLDIFRDKSRDIYLDMAEDIYSVPSGTFNKKQNPNERQVGKVGILGCFEEDTLVLTDRGLVRILDLSTQDKVWDGEEWVSHDGTIFQGFKDTISLRGVSITPDHEIWTGSGFIEAHRVANPDLGFLPKALSSATLPSSMLSMDLAAGLRQSSVGARAAQKVGLSLTTYVTGEALAATHALNVKPDTHRPATKSSWRMTEPATVGLIGIKPFCNAPFEGRTQAGKITEDEESTLTRSGPMPGLSYAGSFSSPAISTRNSNLSAWTTKKAIGRGTANSQREPSRWQTPERHAVSNTKGSSIVPRISRASSPPTWPKPLSQHSQGAEKEQPKSSRQKAVFDVLNAGPRNRFTILTGAGLMVVHNCGYGLGKNKMVDYGNKAFASAKVDLVMDIDFADRVVTGYRTKHKPVVDFWYACERAAIEAMMNPGQTIWVNDKIAYKRANRFLFCRLPSGRLIPYPYPELRSEPSPFREGEMKTVLTYEEVNSVTKKWERTKTYGGKLVENIVQALCRDLMGFAMWSVYKHTKYQILLTVHDELVAQCPIGQGDVAEFEGIMCILPKWAAGFPITAEGWKGSRYRK